jgi:hypothetical protein
MVVEITPIGIETLHWKFYIIWTVLNGSFVPFTYFLVRLSVESSCSKLFADMQ